MTSRLYLGDQGRRTRGVLAQNNLGLMYEQGRGVTQDYQKAASWFRMAAEQGDAEAQYTLGFMYANGEGVSRDYQQAMLWLSKAAEQGDVAAQFKVAKLSLGSIYTQTTTFNRTLLKHTNGSVLLAQMVMQMQRRLRNCRIVLDTLRS
ncbi:MAG: sel1 repeat family protein [Nitrosomonadales bacterium]|nr:sel1 repeat family protein [Nitrosomonadales bacterium]